MAVPSEISEAQVKNARLVKPKWTDGTPFGSPFGGRFNWKLDGSTDPVLRKLSHKDLRRWANRG